jgi:hypothetical protein
MLLSWSGGRTIRCLAETDAARAVLTTVPLSGSVWPSAAGIHFVHLTFSEINRKKRAHHTVDAFLLQKILLPPFKL